MAAETEVWLAEAVFQFKDARVVGQTEAASEWLEQACAMDARLEEIAADYVLG